MGVTKLRLYGQFPIDTIVQIGNAQTRRAGALLPPTRYDDHIANTEAPAIDHHRHCEPQKRRGNLLQHVSVPNASINIAHPGFSMLIGFPRIRLRRWRLPEGELPKGQERPPWGAACGLAMTRISWLVLLLLPAQSSCAGRRGRCRPPYGFYFKSSMGTSMAMRS